MLCIGGTAYLLNLLILLPVTKKIRIFSALMNARRIQKFLTPTQLEIRPTFPIDITCLSHLLCANYEAAINKTILHRVILIGFQ